MLVSQEVNVAFPRFAAPPCSRVVSAIVRAAPLSPSRCPFLSCTHSQGSKVQSRSPDVREAIVRSHVSHHPLALAEHSTFPNCSTLPNSSDAVSASAPDARELLSNFPDVALASQGCSTPPDHEAWLRSPAGKKRLPDPDSRAERALHRK